MNVAKRQFGFTLIELVAVMVILGIVSVGVFGFIRSSTQFFVDTTERDQLLSDSRFVLERLTRELRNALPNSVQLAANANCIEFVPISWSTFYADIPVSPEPADPTSSATVIELFDYDGQPVPFIFADQHTDFAVVYATNPAQVYDKSLGRRIAIEKCTENDTQADNNCRTQDSDDHLAVLGFAKGQRFAADSPASRLYIVHKKVSYCVNYQDKQINRYENVLEQDVYASRPSLMAENVANNGNQAEDQPFSVTPATLSRNGAVTLRLRFERNDEIAEFNSEVHIANVP